MLRIAVLVSGGGTNLQAIIDRISDGYLKDVSICLVLSSKKDAFALKRAQKFGIQTSVLIRSEFETAALYDKELVKLLDEKKTDLVVLAGFTVIFGQAVIDAYKNRIINVHPSLIPAFCGKGFYGLTPHKAALEYGVKVSGATVHFVDHGTDTGPVILQKAIDIDGIKDEYELQEKVMRECEWELLPKAVLLISEGRVSIKGRKVIIKEKMKNEKSTDISI